MSLFRDFFFMHLYAFLPLESRTTTKNRTNQPTNQFSRPLSADLSLRPSTGTCGTTKPQSKNSSVRSDALVTTTSFLANKNCHRFAPQRTARSSDLSARIHEDMSSSLHSCFFAERLFARITRTSQWEAIDLQLLLNLVAEETGC